MSATLEDSVAALLKLDSFRVSEKVFSSAHKRAFREARQDGLLILTGADLAVRSAAGTAWLESWTKGVLHDGGDHLGFID